MSEELIYSMELEGADLQEVLEGLAAEVEHYGMEAVLERGGGRVWAVFPDGPHVPGRRQTPVVWQGRGGDGRSD